MSELRVDPSELHKSGVEVGQIAATVRSAFTNSDTALASAQSGWVGRSASALASMATEWQEATASHHQNLVEHGEKFAAAAKKYGQADEAGASSVRKAVQNIGDAAPTKPDDFDLDTQFNRPQGLVGMAPPPGGVAEVTAVTAVTVATVQLTVQTHSKYYGCGAKTYGQHCAM